MLEFLQKENAKVKNENAKLHREVCRDKTEDFLSLIEACVDVISSICVCECTRGCEGGVGWGNARGSLFILVNDQREIP